MDDITFIDIETSGLDPERHELLEVATIRVDGSALGLVSVLSTRVSPTHIDTADPEALKVNGYCEERWINALPLKATLERLGPTLDGAVLAGHNVAFDWAFLSRAYRKSGVPLPSASHRRLDTASLAWPLLMSGLVSSLSLDSLCQWFGLTRAHPHTALCDAQCALDVARALLPGAQLDHRLERLSGDEARIIRTLLGRLEGGRERYGAWQVNDGRDYPAEALEEVLDALQYCSAELVRLGRGREVRR